MKNSGRIAKQMVVLCLMIGANAAMPRHANAAFFCSGGACLSTCDSAEIEESCQKAGPGCHGVGCTASDPGCNGDPSTLCAGS